MRRTAKNSPITLTGTVYDQRESVSKDDPTSWVNLEPTTGEDAEDVVAELAGEKLAMVRVPFERGDVAFYSRLDMYGRDAVAGGHANYGYSGYFKASVFDGRKWRAFKIWDFVPETARRYANQGEKLDVQARLIVLIGSLAGRVVEWGDRAYKLRAPAA